MASNPFTPNELDKFAASLLVEDENAEWPHAIVVRLFATLITAIDERNDLRARLASVTVKRDEAQ